MKSLNVVQTIAKVLKILATIAMIASFVGMAICLVSGSMIIAIDRDIIQFDKVTFIFGNFTSEVQAFAYMVLCLGGGIVSASTVKYLKNELADGTPFTMRGAKELLRLGIVTMIFPLCAKIAADIICVYGNTEKLLSDDIQGGVGIALILLSFVFRYGAELEKKVKGISSDSCEHQDK